MSEQPVRKKTRKDQEDKLSSASPSSYVMSSPFSSPVLYRHHKQVPIHAKIMVREEGDGHDTDCYSSCSSDSSFSSDSHPVSAASSSVLDSSDVSSFSKGLFTHLLLSLFFISFLFRF